MYADYSFYTDVYYGTRIEAADFPHLASRASDFLDYYTRGKAAQVPETDLTTKTALAKACCAIAEAVQAAEQEKALASKAVVDALVSDTGALKSETVGSYSVSYATASDYMKGNAAEALKNARAEYASIAMEYLVNTGLLYRGEGRRCCF